MIKKLLIFFRIIEEVRTPVQMQWKERPAAEEKLQVAAQKKPEIIPPVQRRAVRNKNRIRNIDDHTENYKEYCLEKTGNQHILKARNYKITGKNDRTEVFFIPEDAFIIHQEHDILCIEKGYFVKYIQQEYNPITQLNENAYD